MYLLFARVDDLNGYNAEVLRVFCASSDILNVLNSEGLHVFLPALVILKDKINVFIADITWCSFTKHTIYFSYLFYAKRPAIMATSALKKIAKMSTQQTRYTLTSTSAWRPHKRKGVHQRDATCTRFRLLLWVASAQWRSKKCGLGWGEAVSPGNTSFFPPWGGRQHFFVSPSSGWVTLMLGGRGATTSGFDPGNKTSGYTT